MSRPPRLSLGRRCGVVAAASRAIPRQSMLLFSTSTSTSMSTMLPTSMLSSKSIRLQELPLASPCRCARSSVATRASRGGDSGSSASVTARWCLDARFGSKAEAAALLVEWAAKIAPRAAAAAAAVPPLGEGGPPPAIIRVLSGAVGASESRLEVEVSGLASVSALELLWSRLASLDEHRAWQERLARHVVDGSTRWEVFYELAVGGRGGGGGGGRGGAATTMKSTSSTTSTSSPPPPPAPSPSQLVVVSGDEAKEILQADAAAARAAVERSNSDNERGGRGGGAGAEGQHESHRQQQHGRGRPRSLERAAAARARAEAAARKDQPSSSSSSSSSPAPSPPSQLPPITISSILGNTSNSSSNNSSNNNYNNNNNSSDGDNGIDTSRLVPGQRLPDGSVVATDWKGDVMIIRPGDRGISGL